MTRRLFAVTVMSLVLVSAIGVLPASAFTKKDACDLVTGDDITELFGAAPVKTTPDGQKGKYTTCTWRIPTPEGAQLTAFVGIDKPNKLNKKDFKANSKSPDAEKVDGIKKAFYLAEGNVGTVTFIQSGNFVNVQFLGTTPEDLAANEDALFELASTLADEL